jgi:O-antigen/teichoic acid export membrane protein
MFVGQGSSLAAQAIYFILIARLLGASEYGLYIAIVSFISLGGQFGTLGSGYVLLRHAAANHAVFREYWGNVLLNSTLIGAVVVALLVAASRWVLPDTPWKLVLLVALSDTILGGLVQCCGQAFQAFEQMSKTATISFSVNLLRLFAAAVLYLRFHHADAFAWAAWVLGVSATVALGAVWEVNRKLGWPLFRPRLVSRHAVEGATFAISSSTTSVYNDIDKIMMGHLGMNAANGVYALAYRAINVATIPVFAIHAAAFPRFFKEGSRGLRHTLPLARHLQMRTLAVTGTAALCLFFAAPLIPFFAGRAYLESASVLRWLCLIPVFRSFQWSSGDAMAGAGLQRYRLALQAGASLFNFGVNLYLIPRFSWHGAAWSSLLTDGLLGLGSWILYGALLRSGGVGPAPDLADASANQAPERHAVNE